MTFPSEEILEQLRRRYPEGTRIELIRMDDPYNKKLGPGSKGTVRFVDVAGTLQMDWDCGSSLGLIPGQDSFRIIDKEDGHMNKPDTYEIDDDFETILICAVRYAAGRNTYMPGLVQDWIMRNCIGKLSRKCLAVMQKDIEQNANKTVADSTAHNGLWEHDHMIALSNWCRKELEDANRQ